MCSFSERMQRVVAMQTSERHSDMHVDQTDRAFRLLGLDRRVGDNRTLWLSSKLLT